MFNHGGRKRTFCQLKFSLRLKRVGHPWFIVFSRSHILHWVITCDYLYVFSKNTTDCLLHAWPDEGALSCILARILACWADQWYYCWSECTVEFWFGSHGLDVQRVDIIHMCIYYRQVILHNYHLVCSVQIVSKDDACLITEGILTLNGVQVVITLSHHSIIPSYKTSVDCTIKSSVNFLVFASLHFGSWLAFGGCITRCLWNNQNIHKMWIFHCVK